MRRVRPRRLICSSGPTDRPYVSLTFDDGPSPFTKPILDVLAEHGVGASFFVMGAALADETKPLVEAAHAAGHDVGNHTHHHFHLEECDEATVREEIRRTHGDLVEILGDPPVFVRPPYGTDLDRVDEIVTELGYRATVYWSIDPRDWEQPQPSARTIVDRVLADERLAAGAIVLMHDGVSPNQPDESRAETVEAVRLLIPALRERGLEPVTLSRLLSGRARPSSQPP